MKLIIEIFSRFFKTLSKGAVQGIGVALGMAATVAVAVTVSGTIKTWTSGETLTASDINTTIASLKTAIENITAASSSDVSEGTSNSKFMTPSSLANAQGFNLSYAFIWDEKSVGGNAGASTNTYTTRDLTNIETNITGVSLSSNEFTLPAGTYLIEASAPATKVGFHKAKLVSDPSGTPVDVLIGTSESSDDTIGEINTRSFIKGVFTLSSSTTLAIQHKAENAVATWGFGIRSNLEEIEIYTQVKLIKIA
jgi:hypothetical protein